jgi:type II secretory pathway pseudopilin PulG
MNPTRVLSRRGFAVALLFGLLVLPIRALPAGSPAAELLISEVRYEGQLGDAEARFTATIVGEVLGKGEVSALLFEGDLAVLPVQLPSHLRLARQGNQYRLVATRPGRFEFSVSVIAKITKADPWNQVTFTGPAAGLASLVVSAAEGVEVQFVSGARVPDALDGDVKGQRRLRAVLGADQVVALRWQGRQGDVTRQTLATCETTVAAQVTPTVIKFQTQFQFEILQGKLARLRVAIPTNQTLTKVEGEQAKDWQVKAEGDRQVLTIEFLKPVEKTYALKLATEQTIDRLPFTTSLDLPQPLEAERETGSLTLGAEEAVVEPGEGTGLRQINAPAGAVAAYRFYGRPVALPVKVKGIEPVLTVASHVTAQLEETRLLVTQTLNLNVEKTGIYQLKLGPLSGFVVTDVRGDGVEDWQAGGALPAGEAGRPGQLAVTFTSRVLGNRRIEVQMEQARPTFREEVAITPLRVTGAARESAAIGVLAAAGIRLKTGELTGLREVPVASLPDRRGNELLAFVADQGDWHLRLSAERLDARVVAEIFNLVTIGDGLVGGSATVRYALFNQGVQEFKLKLPAAWKNVDFTGANIRRKDLNGELWTISLQDKVWGGYTLVITYDEAFDPHGASLALGGLHAVGVERETGTLAVTSAASLQLREKSVRGPLRRVDESELAPTDRALITRSVLLAYLQSAGDDYGLEVEVSRFDEVPVLSAVTDRTQLTTVLTEAGQMLTQASYLVKNNDKPYQTFTLPAGADFWSCYVNGQAVKAERQGTNLLVPLPRGVNRDLAFPVELVYAQTVGGLKDHARQPIALQAPQTDIQTTYAEWELYVPPTRDLVGFGGNLTATQGAGYTLHDAGHELATVYRNWLSDGTVLVVWGLILLGGALVLVALRYGGRGLGAGVLVLLILAVLGGMLLPALAKAKGKAQRINAANNLKEIGIAARLYAQDNRGRFPGSLDQLMNEVGSERTLRDPETSERFVYLGAGREEAGIPAGGVLAYSPAEREGKRTVLLADGSVTWMDAARFGESLQKTAGAAGFAMQTRDRSAERELKEELAASPPQSVTVLDAAGKFALAAKDAAKPPAVVAAPVESQVMRQTNGVEYMGRVNGVAQQVMNGDGAMGGGGFGGRSGLLGNHALAANSAGLRGAQANGPAPTVAGIRPIRIEIPRTGDRFVFTKVLNVRDDKLVLSATVISAAARNTLRSVTQIAAFLAGLLLFAWQWRRPQPNSLLGAVGLLFAAASVGAMLMATHLLGLAIAYALPLAVLVAFGVAVARAWRNRKLTRPAVVVAPAAVASLVALLGLSSFGPAEAATPAKEAPVTGGSVVSASYVGRVSGRVAHIEAEVRIVTTQPNQTVALFGDDLAVETFGSLPPGARLIRDGKTLSVRFSRKGEATVKLGFLVKLLGAEADVNRQLAFAIPPALSSQVTLVVDEPEANVEFPTAVAFHSTTTGGETRVEGTIGSGERVELRWSPRVKRAAEIAATVFCQNAAAISFRGDTMNVRSTLDYAVTQGEIREVRLHLPAGQRLLRLAGDQIRTWQVKEDAGGAVLTVELLKGVASGYRLTVETETAGTVKDRVTVAIPHALDVKRETGWIAFAANDELGVTVDTVTGAQRVDAAEFKAAPPGVVIAEAYQFLRPDFTLQVRVEPLQPQIEVSVRHRIRLGTEQISVSAELDYVIKRVGVFNLRVALPADFRVEAVNGEFTQWTVKDEGGGRVLEVALKQRTLGDYSLGVVLARTVSALPATWAVTAVHPLGVQKLSGFVLVSAEVGVQVKTQSQAGLTEVPAASVPGGGTGLAYKFIAADPVPPTQPWQLTVSNETIEPWVRAEVVDFWTVGENLINGRALVRYEIQNAPVKEFRLRMPAGFKNVEITGANLRQRDQTTNEWRVTLQNKVIGTYTLTVTWELPATITEKETILAAAGVEALGVERETGAIAVMARPPIQVSARNTSSELTRIDASELPEWAGRADPATLLAYRYLRPGYTLALAALQHPQAEVLQALVDEARLTTVIAEDGQMMTEMALSVRNNGRQFLEVALPAGAQVWSSFVAGEAVRPSRRGGKLLLPLERSEATDAAFPVTLSYVSSGTFPTGHGKIGLLSPSLDVPIKSAQWEVYVPGDHTYAKFAGTMTRGEAAAAPVAERFTAESYVEEENRQSNALIQRRTSDLSLARSKLALGDNKAAVRNYYKARTAGEQDEGVRELGVELRKAQSSNLIAGQQQTVFNNGELFGLTQQPALPAAQPAAGNYDAEVAGRQWEKLAQAQEIAVSKVRPLRVTLPRSGLRYSFTQILQTELGQPMQIQFEVANTKAPNWRLRIGVSLGGFLLLWAASAWLLSGRRRTGAAV